MADTAYEQVLELLGNADPEGYEHERLMKIQDRIERNVMLGPKDRRYIQRMVSAMDNVECRHVKREGLCKVVKGECEHLDWYKGCMYYAAVGVNTRESPLR